MIVKCCDYCGVEFQTTEKRRKYCGVKCSALARRKVTERPTAEQLELARRTHGGYTALALQFGVHRSTIKKWAGEA